jgi:hypothetical protein
MHPGLLPTAPLPPTPMPVQVQPVQLPPPPAIPRSWVTIAACGLAILVGFFVGIAVGRATASDGAPAPTATGSAAPAPVTGRMKVSSKPADGNVVVDGRFVGVAPIERVDLEPGKHSIVIDVFGYQPYAGTLEIAANDELNLKVLLAPIGARNATTGSAAGTAAGKLVPVLVPASALQPAASAPAKEPPPPPQRAPARHYEPPPRPHRDCYGEKQQCSNRCWFASGSCERECPGCGSCVSPNTNEDCKRSCESCQHNCKQNSKFCETNCDAQYSSCDASNQ